MDRLNSTQMRYDQTNEARTRNVARIRRIQGPTESHHGGSSFRDRETRNSLSKAGRAQSAQARAKAESEAQGFLTQPLSRGGNGANATEYSIPILTIGISIKIASHLLKPSFGNIFQNGTTSMAIAITITNSSSGPMARSILVQIVSTPQHVKRSCEGSA